MAACSFLILSVKGPRALSEYIWFFVWVAIVTASVPGAFEVFSSFMRRVVVRPDGLDVWEPFRSRFVRSDEVVDVTILGDTAVLRTVDGEKLALSVLDTEGLARAIREM